MILGPDRAKLSKRHGAKSVLDYVADGYLPEALVTFMAYLGWSYKDNSELLTMDQLIKEFDLNKIQVGNPIFDLQKLDYFNAKLIRSLPAGKLAQLIKPFLKSKIDDTKLSKIIPQIQERLVRLGEAEDLISYFVAMPQVDTKPLLKESRMSAGETKEYLGKVNAVIKAIDDWSVKSLEEKLHGLQQQLGLKPRPAFMTIRLAVTGRPATPPLFDVLAILGKDEVIKRLAHVQKILD
jgi:glutamyl-tRNA synthetase